MLRDKIGKVLLQTKKQFQKTFTWPIEVLQNSITLYQDELTTDKKLTVVYSIPDEIPTTCFQLCELV